MQLARWVAHHKELLQRFAGQIVEVSLCRVSGAGFAAEGSMFEVSASREQKTFSRDGLLL